MDASINIQGLRIYANHGVGAQELKVGNVFEVDVSLRFQPPSAIDTDCIDDTVSYADIVDIIKREMAIPSQLLEHVAGRIRKAIIGAYPMITGGVVSVWKVCPPISAELSRVGFSLAW